MAARTPSKGEAAVSELQSTSGLQGTLSFLHLEVTDAASIEAAAKKVEQDFGRLDVLINNAGITSRDPSLRTQLETTFNTNVIGANMVTEAFRPLLIKAPKAYLIHISSGLGSFANATAKDDFAYNMPFKAYRISKAALDMMMLEDWKEKNREGWNMKVFALCPGLVESNLRGTSEEQRTVGGMAISPETSGQTILSVIEGKRDADDGKFVHKDGVYGW